jgi:hypothetical protein
MKTRVYEINICDGCINLEGSECHTPECAFCFLGVDEIKELLRKTNLRVEFPSEIYTAESERILEPS